MPGTEKQSVSVSIFLQGILPFPKGFPKMEGCLGWTTEAAWSVASLSEENMMELQNFGAERPLQSWTSPATFLYL